MWGFIYMREVTHLAPVTMITLPVRSGKSVDGSNFFENNPSITSTSNYAAFIGVRMSAASFAGRRSRPVFPVCSDQFGDTHFAAPLPRPPSHNKQTITTRRGRVYF